MKKKYIIYPIAFIALISMFVQCKKDKPGNTSTCADNPGSCHSVLEAKDYFAFKVGSWWVYEEQNSGERDSVYVTESSIDPNSYNFDVRIYSSYQDFYYHYWSVFYQNNGCDESIPISKRCLFVKCSKYKPGDYIGENNVFFVNYRVGDYETTGYCSNNRIIVENIFNDYSVNNLDFEKTVSMHELCSSLEGNQPTNYFYSKGVGIIRKELIDSNQVWNLADYHIEP